MPPKKCSAPEPSKKTEQKKKEKVIEDKTFGLKNKKGAKQQKFIAHVSHQVQHGNQSAQKIAQQQLEKQNKVKTKEEELAELNKLFKPVAEMPKLAKDVDPKSVLCAFFKQGMCTKGNKCKFSHDLEVERKSEKRSAYVDMRDNEADNIENWDEDKLMEVVEQKHGESNKSKPKTEIVCKHFLQALEDSKYGWFWECPSGGDKCIYRHALPPGFVLKKDRMKLDQQNKGDEITLEELVEKERAALGHDLPKITLENFLVWKQRKRKQQAEKRSQEERRKLKEYKQGKQTGLSGRELFTFNPDLIAQDDDEADDEQYSQHSSDEEDEEGGEKRPKMVAKDIDISMFLNGLDIETANGGGLNDEDDKMDVAGASCSKAAFDEDLFANDEDLDDIDDDEDEDENGEDDEDSAGEQNGR